MTMMNNNFSFVKQLKFYNWSWDFFHHVCNTNVSAENKRRLGFSRLGQKLSKNLFFAIAATNIYITFIPSYEAFPIRCYFHVIPKISWNPYNQAFYFFSEGVLTDPDTNNIYLIYTGFGHAYGMWLWFPEAISYLKQYYPFLNMQFDEAEFSYIDYWIKVLPVFEDLLGHLLINDEPLQEVKYTMMYLYIQSKPEPLFLYPPITENIDFSAHLEEYYFGTNAHPAFLDVMTLYLNHRPSLKKQCELEWEKDKALNKNVSSNLTIYFVCNFLIKNISSYTLRFVVANTPLHAVRPLKKLQNERLHVWNNYSPEEREAILKEERAFLLKRQMELSKGSS